MRVIFFSKYFLRIKKAQVKLITIKKILTDVCINQNEIFDIFGSMIKNDKFL